MSTAALFERLAPRYDELWTGTAIGRAQRNAVWCVVDRLFLPGDRILDIGCGTGEDAVHLAAGGVSVLAVDASPAMVARASARGVAAQVMRAEDLGRLTDVGRAASLRFRTPEVAEEFRSAWERDLSLSTASESRPGRHECLRHENELTANSTTSEVRRVVSASAGQENSAPMSRGAADTLFDGAISNFGALNCVEDLAPVARALGALVRSGGYLAICTMGRFCAWETLYYSARFNFKKALRRLPGRAHDVRYPTVRKLRADFAADFELRCWTGIGMLVPPSYVKLPARFVNLLARLDRLPLLRACADHRLLVFERK